jgi:hypothetical protein
MYRANDLMSIKNKNVSSKTAKYICLRRYNYSGIQFSSLEELGYAVLSKAFVTNRSRTAEKGNSCYNIIYKTIIVFWDYSNNCWRYAMYRLSLRANQIANPVERHTGSRTCVRDDLLCGREMDRGTGHHCLRNAYLSLIFIAFCNVT